MGAHSEKSNLPAIMLVVAAALLLGFVVWYLNQPAATQVYSLAAPVPTAGPTPAPTAAATPAPAPTPAPKGRTLIEMMQDAAMAQQVAEAAAAAEVAARSLDPATYTLTARLAARGGGGAPVQATALVGVAMIDEADLADAEAHFAAGAPVGGGPGRVEDLANVARWIEAPVTPQPDGGARVGPLEVPLAPLYRLAAWESDHRLHVGELVPPPGGAVPDGENSDDTDITPTTLDAGTLTAHEPTRLLVRLINNRPGDTVYEARLARVPDPVREAEAAALQPLLEFIAPYLLNAYRGDAPLVLAADAVTTLSPLLPDRALRLTLRTTAGAESQPVEARLTAGATTSIDIDLDAIFDDEADLTYTLNGQVFRGHSETPLVAARVERIDAPVPVTTTTDERGAFRLEGLPAGGAITRIAVAPPPSETGRPLGPARTEYEVSWSAEGAARDDLPTPIVQSATWFYPVYRWLVLDLPKADADSLKAASAFPYPIYVLQYRLSESADWRTVPADEFLPEKDALAVSLDEVPMEIGGHFRLLVATSSYCALATTEGVVRAEDHEVHVRLDEQARRALGGRRPASLKLIEAGNGIPLGGARVLIASQQRSLPPSELEADERGIVELGPATQRTLEITVAAPGFEPRELSVTLLEDGLTVVELSRKATAEP